MVVQQFQRQVGRAKSAVLPRSLRAFERRVGPAVVAPRVRRVSGPTRVHYAPHQLLVLCVVRNGLTYVPQYLRHHRALGVRHFVFLDNGSTDGTLEALSGHEDVTLLRTDAPYRIYENAMKIYLARRFSTGRWNLCADIDELFDYPYSEELSLKELLRYLDLHGHTAMVAQMLDMFPEGPLRSTHRSGHDDLRNHVWYDISSVERTAYPYATLTDDRVRMHWGGIRRSVFGTRNGLTKAPLVRLEGRLRPFVQWHHVDRATVADVSGVLRHYPFVSTFADKVEEAVRSGRYGHLTTGEYESYWAQLERARDTALWSPAARRLTGLQPLLLDGFLVASERYRQWVVEHGSGPASPRTADGPDAGGTVL